MLALGCAGPARAHVEQWPKRDHLELAPDEVRLVLDYAVPAGAEARALRERFDRDRSGALEAAERARLAAYLAGQATRFAAVHVDGAPLSLVEAAREVDLGDGPEARAGVRLTLRAPARLALARTVQLVDRHKDARTSVPVEVVARGVRLRGGLPPRPLVWAGHPLVVELATSD